MGTNYYLKTNYCPCCGNPKQEIHIGKSSAGWRFNFDGATTKCKNIGQIKEKLKYGNIKDEYECAISYQDFFDMVERKQIEEPRRKPDAYTKIVDGYEFSTSEFS